MSWCAWGTGNRKLHPGRERGQSAVLHRVLLSGCFLTQALFWPRAHQGMRYSSFDAGGSRVVRQPNLNGPGKQVLLSAFGRDEFWLQDWLAHDLSRLGLGPLTLVDGADAVGWRQPRSTRRSQQHLLLHRGSVRARLIPDTDSGVRLLGEEENSFPLPTRRTSLFSSLRRQSADTGRARGAGPICATARGRDAVLAQGRRKQFSSPTW